MDKFKGVYNTVMELKEFIKKVIIDLDEAVTEANQETHREIRFRGVKEKRTSLEFDIAVTVDATETIKGNGGVKVLGFVEGGIQKTDENKNSTASRIIFSLDVGEYTKVENQNSKAERESQFKKTNQNESW